LFSSNNPKPAPGAMLPLPEAVRRKIYGEPAETDANPTKSLKRKMEGNGNGGMHTLCKFHFS